MLPKRGYFEIFHVVIFLQTLRIIIGSTVLVFFFFFFFSNS